MKEEFNFESLDKKTQNTVKRRFSMMLQIKSDALRGILRKAAEYAAEFHCTCFSNDMVMRIVRMENVTMKDAYDFVIETTEKARCANERKKEKLAKMKEEAEEHKRKALYHRDQYNILMKYIDPDACIQLTLDF